MVIRDLGFCFFLFLRFLPPSLLSSLPPSLPSSLPPFLSWLGEVFLK